MPPSGGMVRPLAQPPRVSRSEWQAAGVREARGGQEGLMATMWRRTMLYLGLGPDEEYEEDGGYEEPAPSRPRESAVAGRSPQASRASRPQTATKAPATRPPARERPDPRPEPTSRAAAAGGRPAPGGPPAGQPRRGAPRPDPGDDGPARPSGGPDVTPKPSPVVRQVPAAAKPHLVAPTHFNDAQEVGDRFKSSQPVILNLQEADKRLSLRIIDFASGLCYALGGHMEKVASSVYLLTPADVEVSAEERRRLAERGLHDA